MKSLKVLAVVALFGAFFVSCEAESLNDEQQIDQIEVISSTGDQVDKPKGSDGDDD